MHCAGNIKYLYTEKKETLSIYTYVQVPLIHIYTVLFVKMNKYIFWYNTQTLFL